MVSQKQMIEKAYGILLWGQVLSILSLGLCWAILIQFVSNLLTQLLPLPLYLSASKMHGSLMRISLIVLTRAGLNLLRALKVNYKNFRSIESLGEKSGVDWFQYGNCNSKFYHAAIKKGKRRKLISAFFKDDDSWSYDQAELQDMVISYYMDLYTEPYPSMASILPPLCASWKLNQEDLDTLTLALSLE